jgi:NTP pyrophosphatase (non-canonical NTP hydrolase)
MTITIANLIAEAHHIAVEHGWWSKPRTFGDFLALAHSELSEGLEEYRDGHALTEVYYPATGEKDVGKPEGIPIEFADVIIRIADFCGQHDIDLENALEAKLAYNRGRPMRHGGKHL